MANGYPYFRWFPTDAETDELYSSMTDQELGFFHRCLNRSWVNYGLPSNLDELAKTMHVTRKYLDRVWLKVGKCFKLTDAVHPRLVNPRQEQEREKAISKSSKATDAVRTRYERTYERSTDELLRARARADSDSVSDFVANSQKRTPENLRKMPLPETRFHEWLEGFRGRKADPDAAAQAWISVDGDEHAEAAFACRDRYNASREVADGAVMEASKFIFQQGRNKWAGDWPKARDSPRRESKGEARIAVAAERLRQEELRGEI